MLIKKFALFEVCTFWRANLDKKESQLNKQARSYTFAHNIVIPLHKFSKPT